MLEYGNSTYKPTFECNVLVLFESTFHSESTHLLCKVSITAWLTTSVTRLGDLLDFGLLFKEFGNN